MKNSTMVTIASVLSMLLFMIHVADDIARGIEKGGVVDHETGQVQVMAISAPHSAGSCRHRR